MKRVFPHPATVRIGSATGDGEFVGLGFLVAADSRSPLIATCSHIVQCEKDRNNSRRVPERVSLEFLANPGERFFAKVAPNWWSPLSEKDIAILELESPVPDEITPITLCDAKNIPDIGHRDFLAIGLTGGSKSGYKSAKISVVSHNRGHTNPDGMIQILSSDFTEGFSGSPLIDEKTGHVIAMGHSIYDIDNHGRGGYGGLAVPAINLKEICDKIIIADDADFTDFRWNMLKKDMKTLARKPIYNTSLPLEKIFVQPEGEIKSGKNKWNSVGDLQDYLAEYDFESLKTRDAPLLLYGDFGAGKSSLLKSFSGYLLRNDHKLFPIYIPLREVIGLKSDLENSVISYLNRYGPFDPANVDRDVLFLFDGFDEALYFNNDPSGNDEAEMDTLLRQLTAFIRYDRIHAIISSRPSAFISTEHLIPKGTVILRIKEFGDGKIKSWLHNRKQLSTDNLLPISYENLTERNLLSIAANPLLLYMTAEIYEEDFRGKKTFSKGHIYKLFYDWTIRGKFRDDSHTRMIPNPRKFRRILQNIAFTILQMERSGCHIRYEDLKSGVAELRKETTDENFFRVDDGIITAHFFKIDEHDGLQHVEFVHGSFCEFLVAEKIYYFLRQSLETDSFDKMAWLHLGGTLPGVEEFRFLDDLLDELNESQLSRLLDMLAPEIPMIISSSHFTSIAETIAVTGRFGFDTLHRRSINLSTQAFIIAKIISAKLNPDATTTEASNPSRYCEYIYHICHSLVPPNDLRKNWTTAKQFISGADFSRNKFNTTDLDSAGFVDD